MTGIERLRELAREQEEHSWSSVGKVRARMMMRIADQIEQEHAADCFKMGERDVEDAEAIAWVREHGGLSHVKDICDDFRAVVERIGVEWSESELHNIMEVLDKRLMPVGMEWPRFEDDEPVKFGDKVPTIQRVTKISLFDDRSFTLYNGFDSVPYRSSERVKRPAPKVLDADGVEIRKGDTVWHVSTGERYTVGAFSGGCVNVSNERGGGFQLLPSQLTHCAPVLAADGRPLHEGETVYRTDSTTAFVVDDIVTREDGATVVHLKDGAWHLPQDLTHERPEVDSWERLEEDVAGASCPDVYCANHHIDASDASYEWAMARDIVRRARALAGGA